LEEVLACVAKAGLKIEAGQCRFFDIGLVEQLGAIASATGSDQEERSSPGPDGHTERGVSPTRVLEVGSARGLTPGHDLTERGEGVSSPLSLGIPSPNEDEGSRWVAQQLRDVAPQFRASSAGERLSTRPIEHVEREDPTSRLRNSVSEGTVRPLSGLTERGVVVSDGQSTTTDADESVIIQRTAAQLAARELADVQGQSAGPHNILTGAGGETQLIPSGPVEIIMTPGREGKGEEHPEMNLISPTTGWDEDAQGNAKPLSQPQKLKALVRKASLSVRILAPDKVVDQAPGNRRLTSPPPSNDCSDSEVRVIRMGVNTPDLSHLSGDLLDLRCSIAHSISADVAMERGVAQQINQRFHCKREVAHFRPQVGDVVVTPVREPYYQVIYHLVTKEKFFHKPDISSLTKTLTNLMSLAKMHKATTIAIPHIACGRDGLAWSDVEPIIQRVFNNSGIRILVVTRPVSVPRFNQRSLSQSDIAYGEGRPDEEGEFGPRAFDPSTNPFASGDETSVSTGGERQFVSRFSEACGPTVTLLDSDLRDHTMPLLVHVPANTSNPPRSDVRRGLMDEYPETAQGISDASKGKPPGTWGYNIEKGKLLFFIIVGFRWRDPLHEMPYARGLQGVVRMARSLGVTRLAAVAPRLPSITNPNEACLFFAKATAGTGLRVFVHGASCPGEQSAL
jgi:O-acetyl-ADP-ribose deacetylase (regulator of RNase III)